MIFRSKKTKLVFLLALLASFGVSHPARAALPVADVLGMPFAVLNWTATQLGTAGSILTGVLNTAVERAERLFAREAARVEKLGDQAFESRLVNGPNPEAEGARLAELTTVGSRDWADVTTNTAGAWWQDPERSKQLADMSQQLRQSGQQLIAKIDNPHILPAALGNQATQPLSPGDRARRAFTAGCAFGMIGEAECDEAGVQAGDRDPNVATAVTAPTFANYVDDPAADDPIRSAAQLANLPPAQRATAAARFIELYCSSSGEIGALTQNLLEQNGGKRLVSLGPVLQVNVSVVTQEASIRDACQRAIEARQTAAAREIRTRNTSFPNPARAQRDPLAAKAALAVRTNGQAATQACVAGGGTAEECEANSQRGIVKAVNASYTGTEAAKAFSSFAPRTAAVATAMGQWFINSWNSTADWISAQRNAAVAAAPAGGGAGAVAWLQQPTPSLNLTLEEMAELMGVPPEQARVRVSAIEQRRGIKLLKDSEQPVLSMADYAKLVSDDVAKVQERLLVTHYKRELGFYEKLEQLAFYTREDYDRLNVEAERVVANIMSKQREEFAKRQDPQSREAVAVLASVIPAVETRIAATENRIRLANAERARARLATLAGLGQPAAAEMQAVAAALAQAPAPTPALPVVAAAPAPSPMPLLPVAATAGIDLGMLERVMGTAAPLVRANP